MFYLGTPGTNDHVLSILHINFAYLSYKGVLLVSGKLPLTPLHGALVFEPHMILCCNGVVVQTHSTVVYTPTMRMMMMKKILSFKLLYCLLSMSQLPLKRPIIFQKKKGKPLTKEFSKTIVIRDKY